MTYTLPEGDYIGPYKWFSADTLRAEVDKAYKQGFSHGLKECTPWEDVIIDGLVVAHIYRKEHDTDPGLALHDLISWHVRAALDPKVSSDAQALVERGAEAMRERCAQVCANAETVQQCYYGGTHDDATRTLQVVEKEIRGLK